MPSQKRRAAGRRRAWGRGPIILRFESLEGRQLLAASAQPLPDLVGSSFATAHALDWGDSFHAVGTILNQGDAAVTAPFNVEVFASTTPTISPTSVPLGKVTITPVTTTTPDGLGPNQSSNFDQVFSLPPTAIPDYASGNPIYIALWVDSDKAVAEGNDKNNMGVGLGYDVSPVMITPRQPSALVGSSLGVSTAQATWGQTITVTAQVRNNAQGDAPATRARLVLTPTGLNPGSPYDFTVGYLNVPAVPAWQTVNVVQTIKLPATPPTSLSGGTQFTLSMAQDADYVTDPIAPHQASQGTGLDMTSINITTDPNSGTPASSTDPLPDLAPSNVVIGSKSLNWGYNFQVATTIQNFGQATSGPVEVRFLLTGTTGSIDQGIFLGQTTLSGLAPNTSQDLTQTVLLPNTLPSGVTVSSATVARIAVVVDPDHLLNESLRTNNIANSAPVTLRVLGTDGTSTVPTSPAVGSTLGQPKPAGTVQASTTTSPSTPGTKAAAAAAATAKAAVHTKKLHRKAPVKKESLTSKIEHQLKIFPDNVKNFVNDIIKGKPVDAQTTKVKKKKAK
jgi:hypothetical protein